MARKATFSTGSSTRNAAKFSLYLKLREIKAIGTSLQHVMLLPPNEREAWVEQHGEFMSEAFNEYLDDSTDSLNDLSFDEEMIEMSEDLVVSLQDTFNIVQGILNQRPKLKG